MRIAYNDIISKLDSSKLTCATVNPNYPISNVQDQRLGFCSMMASTSSILIDFTGHGYKINTIALLGHNLDSSATISVAFNYIDDWASPPVAHTLSYNSGIILKFLDTPIYVGTTEIENANELTSDVITVDFLTTESGDYLTTETGDFIVRQDKYAYAKISITNTNTIQLGRIWMGDYLQISPSSLLDFKVTKKRSDINIYGKDRQKISIPGVSWRRIELSFPVTSNDMINNVYTMYKTVANNKSIIFCNFDTIRGYPLVEPLYCSIDGSITFTHNESMKFTYSLNLEEDR